LQNIDALKKGGAVDMTRDSRTGLDVLGYDECRDLLARSPIGRVALPLAGNPPAILPVNYALDDNDIVFRTDASSMLHRAHQQMVAFEIDGIDRLYHLGWSVLVTGTIEEVTDAADRNALADIALGPWAPGAKSVWMRLHPDTMTGRSIPPDHQTGSRGARRR
jgi:uncharacterized protein